MSELGVQLDAVRGAFPIEVAGVVSALRGLTVLVEDLPLPVGSLVAFERRAHARHALAWDTSTRRLGEIVGFERDRAIVMLLGQTGGIRVGDAVIGLQAAQTVGVGAAMLGRVVNGIGEPIDDLGPIDALVPRPISPDPLGAMSRRRITEPMHTGIRAIDLMATIGRGQRVGIFAGPGVGKSSLLGAIARDADSDANVIALIGERGREVRDFIEGSLGAEGLKRSIVVVATGDESPLLRIRAALVACTAAEHLRDQGANVCLMMDSVTRFAHAQRQVGLSVGEPPATKGYTPSVFAALALLLERAGAVGNGCGEITGLYTILVEGDDMTEPVADAARGILDGHLILSRKLAHRGHYPAIDVLDSVSRVADDVSDNDLIAARRRIARLLAIYADVEDLVQIGAYARGSNPEADVAIAMHDRIEQLLCQGLDEREQFDAARAAIIRLAQECTDTRAATQQRQRGVA
jgi:flagellum-specific ATP synthase